MKTPMRIVLYDGSQEKEWNDFVRKSKNGTFLFFRDYMEYHRDRFEDYSLLGWNDKEGLIALLPANRRGDTLISHEGLTYGGFVTDDTMKIPKMLEVFEHTLAYLKERSFTRLIYKTVPHIYHAIPAEEDRYALFLCHAAVTRRGVLAVVERSSHPEFQERRSRAIRKAVAGGLVVRLSGDFGAYWRILTDTLMRTYGTLPVHNLQEIELLHSGFPDNIKLFACFKGETMLAGVVVYESNRVARAQYIATSEEGKASGALDLIFHCLLAEVYRQKPFFDFGTSDEEDGRCLNRGLIDQKEGFGARAVMHDHYEIRLADWEPEQLRRALHATNAEQHGKERHDHEPPGPSPNRSAQDQRSAGQSHLY